MEDDTTILLERAKMIASGKNVEPIISVEKMVVVEFLLTPERYAIEEQYISEVLTLKEITQIPGTPDFVIGVLNLRGRIVSIINLKTLFNLRESGLTELNKVMILRSATMEFGIVADSILANKSYEIKAFGPPPLTLDSIGNELITGVTSDGLILLNAKHLLTSKRLHTK
jgi:purine-binding chemotaxis protein CheW